jgi:predicted glycosyl hydrolase (DUF1957 family)
MSKPFSVIVDAVNYTEPDVKAMTPAQMRAFADMLGNKWREIDVQILREDTPDRVRRKNSLVAILRSAESKVRYWIAEAGIGDDDFYREFHAVALDELDPQDYQEMAASARARVS